MSSIFLKIVNMSISAGWIVLAVIVLRLLLKKAPKWINGVLWAIVGLRLVMPFSLESVLSLIPSAETISPEIMLERTPEIQSGIPVINSVVNPIIGASFAPDPMTSANPLQLWIPTFAVIWLAGIVVLAVYTAVSYWRVRKKVQTAVLLRDSIYQSEAVISPFVLGIIKPKIYLPFEMCDQDMEHVIAHEQAHIKRLDHWWKPLGFLLLTLHWFNPLLWLGYGLLCRDIELACDEKVVKNYTATEKADYSQALLTCSVNRRMIAACPLAFGEVGVKNRVQSVLHYKKPAFWIIALALLASLAAAICFLTNPITTVNDELAVFLDMQIAEHHYSEEHTDDNFIALSQKVLGIDRSHKETTVYMWVLYHEYGCENGAIQLKTGAHIPTVITAKRTGEHGHYELVEYWEPRDGSYYAKDIKERFPWYLHGKALDSQRYVEEQTAFCRKAAEEYFNSSSDYDVVRSFDPVEIVYDDGMYSLIQTIENVPSYMLVNGMELLEKNEGEILEPLGTFEEMTLSKENFDLRFRSNIDYSWPTNDTLKSIKKNNKRAWQLYNNSANDLKNLYLLLEQKDGTFYLGYGYYDCNSVNPVNPDDSHIRWLYKLSETTVQNQDQISVEFQRYDGKKVIKEPPALIVVSNEQSIEALKGTSSWIHEGNGGLSEAVMSDSSHPLVLKDSFPVLDLLPSYFSFGDPLGASLQFNAKGIVPICEIPPDDIQIRCWEEKYWGKTDAKSEDISINQVNGNLFFQLKDGNYVYEVTATWSSYEKFNGTVRYSFYTNKADMTPHPID